MFVNNVLKILENPWKYVNIDEPIKIANINNYTIYIAFNEGENFSFITIKNDVIIEEIVINPSMNAKIEHIFLEVITKYGTMEKC